MSQSPPSSGHSQSSSPSPFTHRIDGAVSIDTLISWLVASKRSLSSIHHVHRATTILSEARTAIESTTAILSRTKYLRRSLGSQLKILRAIQYELEASTQVVKSDIRSTFDQLQGAESKLAENVQLLEQTKIERTFQSTAQNTSHASNHGPPMKENLRDFVDNKPVDELQANIHAASTNIKNAQLEIDQSILLFEDAIQNIIDALGDRTATSSSTRSDFHPPQIPRLLKSLETHAREMAVSLESLVKHFDLCVTAIKHTEGGGAAVAQTIDVEDLPDGVGVEAFDTPAQVVTDEERAEMLTVLENDAAEVEDVVVELQDRGTEMEAQLEQIITWRESNYSIYQDVKTAFKLLEEVSQRLLGHMAESSRFAAQWMVEKAKIKEGISGMQELCEVYDNFLIAYDGMIVEAARRRAVRRKMEKIVNEAQSQLDQLYEDDLNERDLFRSDRGDYLPSDIWQGLDSLPAKFGFQRLDEGIISESVPDLPKEAVAGALKRLKAAQGWHDDLRQN